MEHSCVGPTPRSVSAIDFYQVSKDGVPLFFTPFGHFALCTGEMLRVDKQPTSGHSERIRLEISMRICLLAALAFSIAIPLAAQLVGPSKVDVVIPMPPSLGIRVKSLALVPASDSYTVELHKILRHHLEASRLIQIKESPSLTGKDLGSLDEAAKAALKAGLGPTILLSAVVNSAESGQEARQIPFSNNGVKSVATTTVKYHATVKLLDLATGKSTEVPPINVDTFLRNESVGSTPSYPEVDAVRAQATSIAARKVLGLLLPWADHRSLVFFDNSALEMKELFNLYKAKKFAEALALGQATLAKAPATTAPRDLARLSYDLGMLQLMSSHYPEAMGLMKAAVAKDNDSDLRLGLDSAQEALANQDKIQTIMSP